MHRAGIVCGLSVGVARIHNETQRPGGEAAAHGNKSRRSSGPCTQVHDAIVGGHPQALITKVPSPQHTQVMYGSRRSHQLYQSSITDLIIIIIIITKDS